MSKRNFWLSIFVIAMLFFAVLATSGCGGGGGGGSSSGGSGEETTTDPGDSGGNGGGSGGQTGGNTGGDTPGDNSGSTPSDNPNDTTNDTPSDTLVTPENPMGIERLNDGNENFRMSYSSAGKISNIDGQFTGKKVTSETAASEVLTEMSPMLGTSGNNTKFASVGSTSDASGSEYHFAQTDADGTPYYGRGVTVSAKSDGTTDALTSNLWTGSNGSSGTNSIRSAAVLTQEEAETVALNRYKNDANVMYEPELDPDISTKKVIYSLSDDEFDYEKEPVTAYIVNVQGHRLPSEEEIEEGADSNEGIYFSDAVIVNAVNEKIISIMSNLHGDQETTTGVDESGDIRTFTVDHTGNTYYMRNPIEYNYRIMNGNESTVVSRPSLQGPWDEQAVSLYANAKEVLDWYKNTFGRDSVDGNGGKNKPIQIVAHYPSWPNNAAWKTSTSSAYTIYFGNRSGSTSTYAHSMAVDIDTVTHEINHGMLEASIGVDFPWSGVTAAINQGYADLFGCLKVRKWQHGVNWLNQSGPYRYIRNIANPTDPLAYNRVFSGPITVNNPNVRAYVQIWGVLVSHAAYLMQTNGMSWEDLEQLWYKSMSMGYNASSTMQTVRQCVMKAGRKLGFNEEKLQIIRDAFDAEEIFDSRAVLFGKVTDYVSGTAINGASIKATRNNSTKSFPANSDGEGDYEQPLDLGTYTVEISAPGYVTFSMKKRLSEESKDIRLDAALVKTGNGTISGDIINAENNNTISGVTLKVISGWDNEDGTVLQTLTTDANGHYTLTADAGYYTIIKEKAGYLTSSFNATVAPDSNRQQNSYMTATDIFVNDGQRIVLSWGANPADLDAHLVGKYPDGSTFHIYYNSRNGTHSGATVAKLDVDNRNGNGHETITLSDFDANARYDYFVHWSGGTSSWAESNAVAELYADSDRYEFRAPAETDEYTAQYGYINGNSNDGLLLWHVFTIDGGRLIEVNELYDKEDTENGIVIRASGYGDNDALSIVLDSIRANSGK